MLWKINFQRPVFIFKAPYLYTYLDPPPSLFVSYSGIFFDITFKDKKVCGCITTCDFSHFPIKYRIRLDNTLHS